MGNEFIRSLFSGRKIAIATMHRKERVIAPILKNELGLSPFVPIMNTDELGTFSGEVERKLNPLDAARRKCRIAMELTDCDIAISSEGSFGSHPYLFFSRADDEIVVLIDRKNNIEIVGRALTASTNLDGILAVSVDDVIAFADKVGFPSHGLILKDKEHNAVIINKSIVNPEQLLNFIQQWFLTHDHIWVETDLRAMNNPTRMKVIETATHDLIKKMKSTCPSCKHPGFWIVDAIAGLKCSTCYNPTRSTLAHLYQCSVCKHKLLKEYPDGLEFEEPMYCDFCNP